MIRAAMRFARDFLAAYEVEPRLQVKLAIVVEELVTNALNHGRKGHDLTLSLELLQEREAIRLVMEDNGIAFNPLVVPPVKAPDPETGGGIGLAIVHAWARDTHYARVGEINALALTLS